MALPSLSLIFCSRLIYYHHRRRKKLINKKTENTMCIVLFFNQLSWGMQANQPKGTQGADDKKTITNQQLTSSLWRFTRGWIWWIVILTAAQKMKFLVRGITDDAASLCVSKLDPIMKSFYQSKFLLSLQSLDSPRHITIFPSTDQKCWNLVCLQQRNQIPI